MKKINVVLMSILTILLSSFLAACTFKKAEATFSQKEVVISLSGEIDLDDYLVVSNLEKNQVSYRFENPSLFERNNDRIKAIASGKSYVYAIYQNNNMASMQIVVRKKFDAPVTFAFSEDGVLSWNVVSQFYENETTPTTATSYLVEGSFIGADSQQRAISTTVRTNKIELQEYGQYSLAVKTLEKGYFDASEVSSTQHLYFGFMDELKTTDLSWNDGVLSWSAVAGAKYKVKLDDVVLGDFQTTTTKDLSQNMQHASAGKHFVSVVVYDQNETNLPKESQKIEIEKLQKPVANYAFSVAEGGKIEISAHSKAEKFKLVLTNDNIGSKTLEFENDDVLTSLNELDAGIYDLKIYAERANGLFYESDALEFGKIYKMGKLTFSGRGNNDENSKMFKASIAGNEANLKTNINISGLQSNVQMEGIEIGQETRDIDIQIPNAGQYDLSIIQIPYQRSNEVDGENVFVLNSGASNTLTIDKLAPFTENDGQTITHSYVDGKSTFDFAQVENAQSYEVLIWNGEQYVHETDVQTNHVEFSGKVEDLFTAVEIDQRNAFKFKIVAKGEDDKLSIPSTTEKTLILLDAPITANSGNSTNKTFVWNASNDADSYHLEIYVIDKDTYLANQSSISIDTTSLTKVEADTDSASYTFDDVGYYYAKIYAISADQNNFISSIDCLEEVFYIAEKLQVGTLQFGYDENYKNHSGFTQSTGYFVKVGSSANVENYALTVDSSDSGTFKVDGTENIYLLAEDFATEGQEIEISVVGKNQDSTIYVESDAKVLTIQRLQKVAYGDLVIDDLTTSVTLYPTPGVTGIKIWESDQNFVSTDNSVKAVFDISSLSNFSLRFNRYGSKLQGNIFDDSNGCVYLDSEQSSIEFTRLQAPSAFKYYDGNLTFEHSAVANVSNNGYYVLDLLCTSANDDEYKVSIKFDTIAKAEYEGSVVPFGLSSNYQTISGNKVTLKIGDIINLITSSANASAIASVYNQATAIKFAVYGYQNRLSDGKVLLSSPYAKTESGDSYVTVEKMGQPKLSFSYTSTDYTLSWLEVATSSTVSTETSYQIYRDGEALEDGNITGALSYTFSSSSYSVSKNYEFYIKASNPYYLESADSNLVRIRRLRNISSLTLTDGGDLSYQFYTAEEDFNDGVEVVVGGNTNVVTSGKISISQAGTYTLKVLGKTIENERETTYYINSAPLTWTLQNMESLKPSDTTLSLSNNVLSWNAFGSGKTLSTLNYLVMFKDSEGDVVSYKTAQTSLNLQSNEELYNAISNLKAGSITINVSAHLEAYSVASGGTIYYAPQVVLPNGNNEANHYLYTANSLLKKLSTPEITKVEFIHTDLTDAQSPTIRVSFVGNYDATGEFGIYIDDRFIKNIEITSSADKYTFTLNQSEFNNLVQAGQTFNIKINALTETDLPSSVGKIEITRALTLSSLAFETNLGKISPILEIGFDEENLQCAVGGVVLKVVYQDKTATESTTKYILVDVNSENKILKYDMTEFVKTNLSAGGTIEVSGFINNYANDSNKTYYLSAPTPVESETYNVLTSVDAVTKKTGGFVVGSAINNSSTTYVVEYGGSRFEVSKETEFYFEFPNDWANGSYDLTVYATESNYITSAKNILNFVLNRTEKISAVTMNRDETDLSKVTLSWDNVANASGYLIRLYAQDDTSKSEILYSYETSSNSCGLTEMFGTGYQNLVNYGKISAFDLMSDYPVLFEIVSIGNTGYNNSIAFDFNATLKGNSIETDNIGVDEFGRIFFESQADCDYIYRFVDAEGSELQTWKKLTATSNVTKLDASEIETGKLFNVEIVVIGSAVSQPASSSDFDFVFDSIATTTLGNDLTFIVNDEVLKATYNPNLVSQIAFSMVTGSFTKLYIGLTEDAIMTEEVVSIVPEEAFVENATATVYSYSFVSILDLFRENGFDISATGDLNLYIWSYKQTETVSGSYVVSKMFTFISSFVEESDYNTTKKMGSIEDNVYYDEDYVNTFVLFDNNDNSSLQTQGIFIKITQLEDGEGNELTEPYTTIKFLSKEQMQNIDYFGIKDDGSGDSPYFAINLTSIFEYEDLKYLTGRFLVEYSKIQVSITTTEEEEVIYKFIFSDWLKASEGTSFEFERLPQVSNVMLSAGNLYWNRNGEKATKFYVYFANEFDGDDIGQNYCYYSTTKTSFDASNYANTNSTYYIAVQSISENPFLLSSARTFVTESATENTPVGVHKNEINSKVVLDENGKLIIDWTNGDFYQKLTAETGEGKQFKDFKELGEALEKATFTSPFTFTLADLLNNKIVLRFRFTAKNGTEGIRQIFDVNAKLLLTNLYDFGSDNGFDIKTRLEMLHSNATISSTTKSLLAKFIEFVENGSYGIANYSVLFDDYFEDLQMGAYKMEYCLVGTNKTLSSGWYLFENENITSESDKKSIYVNTEPEVKFTRKTDETDKAKNTYQVIIKKSKIYTYKDGAFVQTDAESYVMKLYDSVSYYAFSITKGIDNCSLTLLGDEEAKSVSVYECDSQGEEVSNGDYLSFFVNYNEGDSILGQYADTIKRTTFGMQIYAVGNKYSLSSKSKYFSMTIFGFGNGFAINSGVFTWTPQAGRNTSIIIKKATSSSETVVEVDGSMAYSKYSLDGLGNGLYDYIKFVTIGEIKGNTIYIDSEIYEIENVYKLSAPNLNNDFGYIGIDDSNNITMLNNCYSDGGKYNYMLYNDYSTVSSYITFVDENNARSILRYQPGTTGIDNTCDDYRYKQTEANATQFKVASLGTTASIVPVQDEEKYYLKHIYCKDIATGEASSLNIAVRSAFALINASMMDVVTNLEIKNGVLTWDNVSGKSGETPLTLPEDANAKVVYKVSVVQYAISNISTGETDTNVGEVFDYYTSNNWFDFTLLEENQLQAVDEKTYLKATVQALALNVYDERQTGDDLSLIEGKFASGNVQFANSETFVLIGEGAQLKQIDRLETVLENSFEVIDGSLYWQYATAMDIDETNFFERYSFVVTDSANKEIAGTFSATQIKEENGQRIFKIKFIEDIGAMPTGTQTLKVYASQGSKNTNVVIKSFAREVEITKLATIMPSDYVITQDNDLEVLDLSSYFSDSNTNTIYVTFEIFETAQTGEPIKETYSLSSIKNKIYILSSNEESENLQLPADFVGYVVISTEQFAKMTFKVINSALANTLYSDLSEEFVLQRSSWGDGSVTWDSESQQFNWAYDGNYALKENVNADKIKYADVLKEETTLYSDSALQEATEIKLEADTEITVVDTLENSVDILYLGEHYFIDKNAYENKLVKVGTQELSTVNFFKIESKQDDFSVISFENGDMFKVSNSSIVEPIYLVEATYTNGLSEIVRTYTTSQNFFQPTITGNVGIKIKVKLGYTNIQSKELVFTRTNEQGEEVNYVEYNLFESGSGTSSDPYIIATASQFKNIAYRMTKEPTLNQFIENKESAIEEEQFYFTLSNDIVLSEQGNADTYIAGILFAGKFEGVLDGKDTGGTVHKISYISSGISRLSQSITVSIGNIKGPENETEMRYSFGSALFENIGENAVVQNINLDVSYSDTRITNSALLAGVTILNNGKLDNVNLIRFNSGFYGYFSESTRLMMIYSGLASINTGTNATIKNCNVLTNMEITDKSYSQVIFVSGIAYTNYATIENCVVGQKDGANLRMQVTCYKINDSVQVAGVAITNSTEATIKNCSNYFNITVEGTNDESSNLIKTYIAGIVDLGMGTIQNVVNNGTLTVINIGSAYATQGDTVATTR